MLSNRRIYLDYGASTPTDPEVVRAMQPYFLEKYGNASSIHSFGQEAKEAMEQSRAKIAEKLGAKPEEIYFTSGGTESNNWALKCCAFVNKDKGKHVIVSKIEHDCVLRGAKWLEKQGFEVTYLGVDPEGFVRPEDLKSALRKDTVFVSIIHGNNEIGTIQDLDELGKICKDHGVLFHTDACQSFTKVSLDVSKTPVDLITINAHKIYGPKGVGALYARSDTKIGCWQHGGGHERDKRSGTENIPGIVGFAKAVEIMKPAHIEQMAKTRDLLIKGVEDNIEDYQLNGPKDKSKKLCNNANFCFGGIEGEAIVLKLDGMGIAASTASACSSHTLETSHVLKAIGLPDEISHGSMRLTTGKGTSTGDIKKTIEALKKTVVDLRKMSPIAKLKCFKEEMKENV
ncbi:MAG: cysteine desulfurase family protein [archaeon]